VRSLGDNGLAEEAVQETFVRAWRAADRYDAARAPLRAWLFAICRNVVIDMSRARQVRPKLVDGEAEAARAPRNGGGDAIDKVVTSWALEEALGRIGADHRRVLVEVLILDRPQEAVAADLGVPVGTVKSRVFYGLRNLRKALHDMGWTDS
jgi:RNA polymerase sigma-70 factor (ECF subfamily)